VDDVRKTHTIGARFPRLRVVKGKHAADCFPVFGDRLVIGRRRGDLVLPDPEISAAHCEIVRSAEGYLVRDLRSTNGTFVNGEPIKEHVLSPGDQLGVGRTVLEWEEPPEEGLEGGIPLTEEELRNRISVGIYDNVPTMARLGSLVEDALVGLEDPDGTEVMDLQASGVDLRLPARSVVQLEIVGGPEKGKVITLPSGNVIIGRFGTDVTLKDPDISRRHLAVEVYGRDQIFMQDLQSTNGCYVNGSKLEFAKLQSGDTVVIGRSVIQLVVKELV